MPLIEQPWARVRRPTAIPDPLTAEGLLELEDDDLAQLIRSHLMPREQSGPGRRSWDGLWALVKRNDQLADRVYDILEDFLDTTEQATTAGDLDEAAQARARKFVMHCEQAWARVDRGREQASSRHLAWAGRAGDFQPAARRVIATLVGAIARHRAANDRTGTPEDLELWSVLRKVDLDPDDYADLR